MFGRTNVSRVLFAVTALVCLTAGIVTAAAVTQSITYQGKLTNAAGSPLTGTYSVIFTIYDASTGGTALNTDTHSVTATNGLFTTPIAVGQQFFDGRALWLGIKVGADPEMTPRQEIRPVPYAMSLRPGAWITSNDSTFTLNLLNRGGGIALNVSSTVGNRPAIYTESNQNSGIFAKGKEGGFFTTNQGGTNWWTDRRPAINVSTVYQYNPGMYVDTLQPNSPGIYSTTHGDNSQGFATMTYGNGSPGFNAMTAGLNSPAVRVESAQDVGVHAKGVTGIFGTGTIGVNGSGTLYGISGYSNTGRGVYGVSSTGPGVFGSSTSMDGVTGGSTNLYGVSGYSTNNVGVYGAGNLDTGVKGSGKIGVNGTGSTRGVSGYGPTGIAGIGIDSGVPPFNIGGTGVRGEGNGYGVWGSSTEGVGVYGMSTSDDAVFGVSDSAYGVHGFSDSSHAVHGESTTSTGVYGSGSTGVYGSGSAYGVWGQSPSQVGVQGHSPDGTGVYGSSLHGRGVNGIGTVGLYGSSLTGGTGIIAKAPTDNTGKAAEFYGNVLIKDYTGSSNLLEFGEGLDYSEGFDVSGRDIVMPGTVLVISPDDSGSLTVSSGPYDRKVAGIVAGANGLGSAVKVGGDQFDTSVALAGRVYCNVDATYGAVKSGDMLTTSATPGYAMVVQDYTKAQGATIGKAMQSLEQGQKGQILVLVTLQ